MYTYSYQPAPANKSINAMWIIGISVYVISGPWHRFFEIHQIWPEQGFYNLHFCTSANYDVIFQVIVFFFLLLGIHVWNQIANIVARPFLYLFIIFRNAYGRHSNDELFITVSHCIVTFVDHVAESEQEMR